MVAIMFWLLIYIHYLTACVDAYVHGLPRGKHLWKRQTGPSCPDQNICVNGFCTPAFFNIDLSNCGSTGSGCNAGELCVAGVCTALPSGSDTSSCNNECTAGQWCDN